VYPHLKHTHTLARVTTDLNFGRSTEAAFQFYKSAFGTEFIALHRYKDAPAAPGQPPMPEADKNLVMHVALPILGGHVLMGSDAPDSMGFSVKMGNNFYINLEPDTRVETDRLFKALAEGGKADMAPQEMFWGAYWGSLTDKFGVQWMFNCMAKA
jgi:PhnB protein